MSVIIKGAAFKQKQAQNEGQERTSRSEVIVVLVLQRSNSINSSLLDQTTDDHSFIDKLTPGWKRIV